MSRNSIQSLRDAWDMYQEEFVNKHFAGLPPMIRELIMASFYCGAQASSSIIQQTRDAPEQIKPEVRQALALATVDKLVAEADKAVDDFTMEKMARARYPNPPHGIRVISGDAAINLLRAVYRAQLSLDEVPGGEPPVKVPPDEPPKKGGE